MADVVVDQKPMDKLPFDPNDIPDAVKKRAAAVDALYGSDGRHHSSRLERRSPPVSSLKRLRHRRRRLSPRRRRLRNLLLAMTVTGSSAMSGCTGATTPARRLLARCRSR